MITTRQDVQLHTVRPQHLSADYSHSRQPLDHHAGSLWGCRPQRHDLSSQRSRSRFPYDTYPLTKRLSDALLLNSPAYFEIFVPEKLLPADLPAVNPIYGEALLPRKFKIAVGLSTDNCTFPHTNDIGLIALVNPAAPRGIDGFNVLVGGGLGSTPLKPNTHPALGQPLGMVAEGGAIGRAGHHRSAARSW